MTEKLEVPLEVKAVSILRNHLELAVDEITALLKEEEALHLKAHVEGKPVAPTQPSKLINAVRGLFPKDLEELLEFTEHEGYILLKPKRWLGTNTFAEIASIVKEISGDYVSAGKESHFRIPKEKLKNVK